MNAIQHTNNIKGDAHTPLRFSKEVTSASKGLAVILMLAHHLFYCCPELSELYNVHSTIFSLKEIYKISEVCKLCVAVFVFLTAYGMTAGGADRKLDPVRRLKRLMVPFWIVYIAAIFTYFLREDHLAIYLNEGRFKGILSMVIDALGLANMTGTPTYNETWWYMTLAILLIFMLPIIIRLYNRFGLSVLGLSVFIPYFWADTSSPALAYLFPAVLGIWAANSSYFEKLQNFGKTKTIFLPLIGSAALFALCCAVRGKIGLIYWADTLSALFLITFLFLLVDCTPLKLRVLTFLGRYSMNIFLVHTLLFEYYFPKQIYAPGNWLLIVLVLLLSSLAIAVLLTPLQNQAAKLVDRLTTI